jgi:hypothetical protein
MIVAVFMEELNSFSLSRLPEDVSIVTADLLDTGAFAERVIASIERPLVLAIRDFIYRSGDGSTISVPAVLRRARLDITADATDN